MKKLLIAISMVTLLGTTQCTSAVDNELKALDEVLIKGHDDVMPKSMKLGNLKEDVLKKAAEADSTTKQKATEIANELQTAEDAMYKWMDDYSVALNDTEDKAKRLEMYKKLQAEIEKIKADTDKAMNDAKAF